jgi:hypothetical protein
MAFQEALKVASFKSFWRAFFELLVVAALHFAVNQHVELNEIATGLHDSGARY